MALAHIADYRTNIGNLIYLDIVSTWQKQLLVVGTPGVHPGTGFESLQCVLHVSHFVLYVG